MERQQADVNHQLKSLQRLSAISIFARHAGAMLEPCYIALIEKRRDAIRAWLDEAAPYAAHDQRHLDAHTPEQAYWQYGYQAALADIVRLLTATTGLSSDNADKSNQSQTAATDGSDSRAD